MTQQDYQHIYVVVMCVTTPHNLAGINTITSDFSTVLPWTLGDITLKTMILVNNQLHAQFFMYVYLYSLRVSGSRVPIIRRIIVSMRHLVYVTLLKNKKDCADVYCVTLIENILLHCGITRSKS